MTRPSGPIDPSTAEDAALADAAGRGDDAAFAQLAARYRADVQLHCYRMLGSLEDSEDVTQETLLRAWKAIGGYEGRSGVRTWLHRIATNACLDVLARQQRRRRLLTLASGNEPLPPAAVAVPWLQPYPDHLIGDPADTSPEPATATVTRETVELTFIAALQLLPDAARAALILRDVLGWPATECAQALGLSVPAVNSALQRARAKLRTRLGPDRSQWRRSTDLTEQETALLHRYMRAIEAADDQALAALLAPAARVSHQPGAGGHHGTEPVWYAGRATILESWAPVLHSSPALRLRMRAARANRQPAAATYLHVPGESAYRAFSLSVVTMQDGLLTELAQFGPELFPAFGLPDALPLREPG
ncbi:RNA polymerase subunit sigma-70 [Cryptosporangium minutisporangium]|uniref:RNA polymerase sigma factor n=1 Tax=Cryptosporangium minutisporangium TaxID=113569 RepID=A0ABP6SP75_9ACTN